MEQLESVVITETETKRKPDNDTLINSKENNNESKKTAGEKQKCLQLSHWRNSKLKKRVQLELIKEAIA